MHTSHRSILVEVAARSDPHFLDAIAALARRENARLTLLAAIYRPPALAFATPMALPVDLTREAQDECATRLQAALERLPDDVTVTGLIRHRPAVAALRAELRTGRYDLLAVQTRRVARAVRRRVDVPVLVVDAEWTGSAARGVAA
jgi:hypothetical protein